MNEKISIIIPVYNGEKTIKRCLNSVLNQTYTNLEVIVIDDGSTDSTAAILATYTDKRLIVMHEENKGQGIARNYAMSLATGDYIGFVDCDDSVDIVMYETLLSLALGYHADVVQCNLFDVYHDDIYCIQLAPITTIVDCQKEPDYFSKYVAAHVHSFEVCNKLFRADFIKENHLTFADTRIIQSEDLLFNFEMILHLQRIVFLETPYYYYYQNENSHSKQISCDSIKRLHALFQQFIGKTEDKKVKRQVCGIAIQILLVNVANLLRKTGNQYLNEMKKFVSSKEVKAYMRGSMHNSHLLRHKMIMLCLLTLPPSLSIIIIRRHYIIKRSN